MDALTALLDHYKEWQSLAKAEQRSIQKEVWNELSKHANQKQALQQAILDLEKQNPTWKKHQSDELRSLIHQVSDLESLNQSLLAEKMKTLKIQVEGIKQKSSTNLKLRKHYGSKVIPAGRRATGQG